MSSGKSKPKRSSRSELGARDRRIVSDIVRLKLLTNDAVRQLHLPAAKANATVKVTSRLVRKGWLKAYEYSGRQQYFVAGPTLIRTFGLPASRSRPLGPQALATNLAIIEHIAVAKPRLLLLTESEISITISDSTKSLRMVPHAVEPDANDSPLRLIKVDLGRQPTDLAGKLEKNLREYLKLKYYSKLIEQRRLIIVVLTATESKKSLIEAAITKRTWPKNIRFNLFAVPVLCSLLGDSTYGR